MVGCPRGRYRIARASTDVTACGASRLWERRHMGCELDTTLRNDECCPYAANMAEPNLLLEALVERAGLSHAGLARQFNLAGAALGLRYDHASVARWIRDHAIPRDPVPAMICTIIGVRLGVDIAPLD